MSRQSPASKMAANTHLCKVASRKKERPSETQVRPDKNTLPPPFFARSMLELTRRWHMENLQKKRGAKRTFDDMATQELNDDTVRDDALAQPRPRPPPPPPPSSPQINLCDPDAETDDSVDEEEDEDEEEGASSQSAQTERFELMAPFEQAAGPASDAKAGSTKRIAEATGQPRSFAAYILTTYDIKPTHVCTDRLRPTEENMYLPTGIAPYSMEAIEEAWNEGTFPTRERDEAYLFSGMKVSDYLEKFCHHNFIVPGHADLGLCRFCEDPVGVHPELYQHVTCYKKCNTDLAKGACRCERAHTY